MILTQSQKLAIEKTLNWYYYDTDKKNMFVIAGYAGTGKTTIVKIIIDLLGLNKYNVLYVAFTGKATNILRIKGNMAFTIHKTFYNIYKNSHGKIQFNRKNNLSSTIKLIVVDELSMINDKMIDDIISFNIPIIALGDPGQLPPIFGGNRFIDNSDIFLTEIMRQTDESGILTLATMARENKQIKIGSYGNSKVVETGTLKDLSIYDVILCWKNETRQFINANMRNFYNYKSRYPVKGEKLICLKNNYFHEIDYFDIPIFLVNGLNCVALSDSVLKDKSDTTLLIEYKPDFITNDAMFFMTKCYKHIFDSYVEKIPKDVEVDPDDDEIVYLDYGYALTVHKSQGSEWNKVLIVDDYAGSKEVYQKWLYTAITRGKHSITLGRIM